MDEDILEKLDGAWNEDFKVNLMHFCDLAAQEIRKCRAQITGGSDGVTDWDIMLGMSESQQPVLLIHLGKYQGSLTVPKAKEFAESLLRSCEKSNRCLGANDR